MERSTALEIMRIERMTQYEIGSFIRFGPTEHKYFDEKQPYYKILKDRFEKLGGMTSKLYKEIEEVGWE